MRVTGYTAYLLYYCIEVLANVFFNWFIVILLGIYLVFSYTPTSAF